MFVNLRDENNLNNSNNFPSKILHYLKYCKPIISTDQLSYSKELRKILLLKKKNKSYEELIKKAIKFDKKFLLRKYNQSKKLLKNITTGI